jgi:hypothetical protein
MQWRLIINTMVVLVIIPSLLGVHDFSPLGNILYPGSQSPYDTKHRDSRMPECPNCISLEDSIDPFLYEYTETYQLNAGSPLISIAPHVLIDQGFVTSIFRPPASIL